MAFNARKKYHNISVSPHPRREIRERKIVKGYRLKVFNNFSQRNSWKDVRTF